LKRAERKQSVNQLVFAVDLTEVEGFHFHTE